MLRKKIGNLGEQIAKKYYQNLGYLILEQNYWTRYGELDLVLEKNSQISVVEVKTRSNYAFGWAEEAINNKKIANIEKAYYVLSQKKSLANNYSLEICLIHLKLPKATIKRIFF